MADGHGSLDILSEQDLKNLAFQTHDQRLEISGANLNALLKGLFLLFSKIKTNGTLNENWEDLVEPSFVCLNQICSIEEIMSRINDLCRNRSPDQELRAPLFHGAIRFIWFWIHQFSCFISHRELIVFHLYLCSLRSRLRSLNFSWLESWVRSYIDQIISEIERKALSPQVAVSSLEPNFFLREGNWDGSVVLTAKQKTEVLKTELSKMPKLKLEIFGADMLLDDDDDEDVDKESTNDMNEESNNQVKVATIPFPTTRILKGVSLLRRADDILSLDTVELARQWTLVDHRLFCSIPLFDLLLGCFSQPSTCFEYTDKLFENIRLNGMKKMVDRFNAASLWVTEMVLSGESSKLRSEIISKFIHLASEMQKMGNYNGLMIILTALQQGCISRLSISFDLVPKEDINVLNSLKRLMAGAKNYASYREELLRISLNLPVENVEGMKGWRHYLHDHDAGYLDEREAAPFNPGDQSIEAVIPHLAAHLGALTGITECLSDYLSENVHLLNLTKWKHCTNVVSPLYRLQRLKYNFRPIKAITCSLHAQWKVYYYESVYQSKDVAKRLYAISESKESTDAIYAHFHKEEIAAKEAKDESDDSSDDSAPTPKIQTKIRAYDRITKLHLEPSAETPKSSVARAPSQFSILTRMFSRRKLEESESVSNESSEEEQDSRDDEESEEEEDDESEENEEVTESTNSNRSRKGKNLFRSISKFLFSK